MEGGDTYTGDWKFDRQQYVELNSREGEGRKEVKSERVCSISS
jgi:hypothetical protein